MKPTQEQVIAWAMEAGFITKGAQEYIFPPSEFHITDQLKAAFTLAYEEGRKDENEACAKACEHFISSKENNDAWTITRDLALQAAADVIRARREQ